METITKMYESIGSICRGNFLNLKFCDRDRSDKKYFNYANEESGGVGVEFQHFYMGWGIKKIRGQGF